MVSSGFIEYLHAGGNRQPAAADWDVGTGIIAFGSNQNVAIWEPLHQEHYGIRALLKGHIDTVNAVKFLPRNIPGQSLLLTGSSDSTIRVWKIDSALSEFRCLVTLQGHKASINAIATTSGSNIFVTAAADSTLCIWNFNESQEQCHLLNTFSLSPSYIPQAMCLHPFPNDDVQDSWILAVGGTRTAIQLFTLTCDSSKAQHSLQANLRGHEGWIRSLTATYDNNGHVLIASASQDKYVRLWRIKQSETPEHVLNKPQGDLLSTTHPLKKKVQMLKAAEADFTVSFEALLLGHEDWIYSAAWSPMREPLQLLTASADNSLSVWEADEVSGIWTSVARLGEISEQKGSTTATGSSGGLWSGLWSPTGDAIASLGRTGSWRLWQYDKEKEYWVGEVGVNGHVRPVTDLSWEPEGSYLLSTSLDQTSRLHARWKRPPASTWHEFSRPQIHGYDLNCLTSLGARRFVSGAEEKLLRVFDEPKAVGKLLSKLCGIKQDSIAEMPEAADMPVLGLSNKVADDDMEAPVDGADETPQVSRTQLDICHAPLEDHLARHTLWPETEKLYGHGYEISAVASSHDHSLIATACKASSIDHAVIRLYDTNDWHEIRPPLTSHTLTITRLQFSIDDQYLLSVGRDRQWAVFRRTDDNSIPYKRTASNPKGHSRMILDAAWAPLTQARVFATAGRDKTIKIWQFLEDTEGQPGDVSLVATITMPTTVTAINFASFSGSDALSENHITLASGGENGQISLHKISLATWDVQSTPMDESLCPSKAVTRLAWRPRLNRTTGDEGSVEEEDGSILAVASADFSMRLLRIVL